ncbi:MAG: translation initiation factor IF-6 [Candidatus Thermoplasmatota archaeon]
MLKKLDLGNSPFLGVFCRASEDLVIIPPSAPERFADEVGQALDAHVVRTSIDSTELAGSLVCMNSRCALVSRLAHDREIGHLGGFVKIRRVPYRLNAVGNNILVNDRGAVVHPGYDDTALEFIAEEMEVEVVRGTIAGMGTVGSSAAVTNRGAICHPKASEEEMAVLKAVLGVPVTISTANYGSGLLGACMIANSKGAVVGSTTTPIELGRIEEGLGL